MAAHIPPIVLRLVQTNDNLEDVQRVISEQHRVLQQQEEAPDRQRRDIAHQTVANNHLFNVCKNNYQTFKVFDEALHTLLSAPHRMNIRRDIQSIPLQTTFFYAGTHIEQILYVTMPREVGIGWSGDSQRFPSETEHHDERGVFCASWTHYPRSTALWEFVARALGHHTDELPESVCYGAGENGQLFVFHFMGGVEGGVWGHQPRWAPWIPVVVQVERAEHQTARQADSAKRPVHDPRLFDPRPRSHSGSYTQGPGGPV